MAKPNPTKHSAAQPRATTRPTANRPHAPAGHRARSRSASGKPAARSHPAAGLAPHAPTAPLTAEELAKLAIGGDLDVLARLVDGTAQRDLLAYKWLAIASDFGHEAADAMLAELRERGVLDDAQIGRVHFEVGVAYLTGTEGLPPDFDKARSQLASAKERAYPGVAAGLKSLLQRVRGRLTHHALAVFDAVFRISSAETEVDVAWGNEHAHDGAEPHHYAHDEPSPHSHARRARAAHDDE